MTITKDEASIAWNAINFNEKSETKTFALSQLQDASKIAVELKAKCVDKDDKFVEGDVELNTDQKKLLRDSLDRPWSASAGESVLSLRDKLNS